MSPRRIISSRGTHLLAILAGTLAATIAIPACQVDSGAVSEAEGAVGRVSIGLVGTASSGAMYRLTAHFQIQGPVDTTLDGTIDETSVSTEVPVGNYLVTLVDGWSLERFSEGSSTEVVDAQLISNNPQEVHVESQSISQVRFDFLAAEGPISVGNGGIEISIGVSDGSGAFTVGDEGYFTSASWRGFAWTAAVGLASIEPTDFAGHAAGSPLCVSGNVPPQLDFGGVGILGMSLNQLPDPEALPGVVEATGDGVAYQITSNTAAPLRIQIQGPDGVTDPDDRWCAAATAGSGFIPWSAFNTTCWDGQGLPYDMQPLAHVMVLVPGNNFADTPFDFCLDSIGPE